MVILREACLTVEGLEALRLADLEGLEHEAASARMQVSRQTFGRILAGARRTVAEALVRGLAIRVEGGTYAIGRHGERAPRRRRARRGPGWRGRGR